MKLNFESAGANNLNGKVASSTSLLRVLWLRIVRGYRIMSIQREPIGGLFGSIRYHNMWTLTRRERTNLNASQLNEIELVTTAKTT